MQLLRRIAQPAAGSVIWESDAITSPSAQRSARTTVTGVIVSRALEGGARRACACYSRVAYKTARSAPTPVCSCPQSGTRSELREEARVTKDHGPSVKNDKQYEGLRKKGMSKSRAAAIANSPGASSRGGKSSGSSQSSRSSGRGSGGNQAQKKAAGRKGGKKSS